MYAQMQKAFCSCLPSTVGRGAVVAFLAGAVLFMATASAQNYPNRPVRLVVPFSPGGPADVLGRVIAGKLSGTLGQTVVVVNKEGAGTVLGVDFAAKSTPDGYTLLVNSMAMVVNTATGRKLPYDLFRDFAPVSVVFKQPQILVVNRSLPVNSVKDLIALAKSRPGKVLYGTSGVGSAMHLHAEMLRLAMGVDMTHVPYKGQALATTDLLSGQIGIMFSGVSPVVPYVRNGKLKALGVSTPERLAALPDVPTLMEGGLTNFSTSGWYGMWVPASTPRSIITRLNGDVVKIMSMPDVVERLGTQGGETASSTPEEFAVLVRDTERNLRDVIQKANIKLQ